MLPWPVVTMTVTGSRRVIKDRQGHIVEDARAARRQMVAFSKPVYDDLSRLRGFLYERMYKHYKINRVRSYAKRTLNEMFQQFMAEPDTLSDAWFQLVCARDTETGRARVVCDYIAGMTDAYAIEEHRRLFSFGG